MTNREQFITEREYEPVGFDGLIGEAVLRSVEVDIGWQYGAAKVRLTSSDTLSVVFYDEVVSIRQEQELREFVAQSLVRARQAA